LTTTTTTTGQGQDQPAAAYQTLSTRRMVGMEEVITPTIILLEAAAASIYANSGQLDLGGFMESLSEAVSPSTTSEQKEEDKPKAEEPISTVMKAEAPAAPAVVEKSVDVKEVATASATTPASTPAPTPSSPPATKTTTELVKEVASTRQEQLKTENLVASRQAAAAKASTTSSASSTSSSSPKSSSVEEPLQKESLSTTTTTSSKTGEAPKKKKKRRFVLRILKKVIAPWRKWENIS
jgi:hypothetical protein